MWLPSYMKDKQPCAPMASLFTSEKHDIVNEWIEESRYELASIPDYVVTDQNGHINVKVRSHIMSIQNVDTVNQSFDCKFWIQFKWSVTKPFEEVDTSFSASSEEWIPKIDILNNRGKIGLVNTEMYKIKKENCTDVYLKYVLQGSFAEHFELRQFPFDQQRLHIKLVFWGCPQSVKRIHPRTGNHPIELDLPRSVQFYRGNNIIYDEAFIQRDTWNLDTQLGMRQGKTLAERHDDGIRYTTLNMFITIQRHVGFYVYNIIFPVFLLVILSCISFCLGIDELSNRMQITLTLLLTLVALKYVVCQYLPTTSYMTYLDIYVLISFLFMTIVALQNVLCYMMTINMIHAEEHTQVLFNKISGYTIMSLWMICNAMTIIGLAPSIRARIISSEEDERIERIAEYKERDITPYIPQQHNPLYSPTTNKRIKLTKATSLATELVVRTSRLSNDIDRRIKSELPAIKTPRPGPSVNSQIIPTNNPLFGRSLRKMNNNFDNTSISIEEELSDSNNINQESTEHVARSSNCDQDRPSPHVLSGF